MTHKVPRRYWFAVTSLLGFAFLVVVGITVQRWVPAWIPPIGFAVFGLGPLVFYGFLGAFIFDPTKTSDAIAGKTAPRVGQRLRLTFEPIVAVGLLFLLLTTMWTHTGVREAVATAAGEWRMTSTLGRALYDPEADVRFAACEALDAGGREAVDLQLAERLNDPDDRVVDCVLGTMAKREQAPFVLAMVADRWATELVHTEKMDGDRACRLSHRVGVSDQLGYAPASMRLFECSLQAKSDSARDCCAQSFRGLLGPAGATAPALLPDVASMIQMGFTDSVPRLLEVIYSEEPREAFIRQQLRLDGPNERAWALSLACEGLTEGGARWRPTLSNVVADAVSSPQCHLDPATETTVRLWTAACSQHFDEDLVVTESPELAFCEAVQGAVVADAVVEGQGLMSQAMRQARMPQAAGGLLRALLDYGATRGSVGVRVTTSPRRSPIMDSFFELADDDQQRGLGSPGARSEEEHEAEAELMRQILLKQDPDMAGAAADDPGPRYRDSAPRDEPFKPVEIPKGEIPTPHIPEPQIPKPRIP